MSEQRVTISPTKQPKKMSLIKFKTKRQQDRYNRLLPDGIPKKVRIYDNGGSGVENGTVDRYTCVFTGSYKRNTGGVHWYIGFSAYPFHPQGVGHHGESHTQIDVKPGSWAGPSIGKKCHLGTRIRYEDLPEDGQKFVMQDYLYLWSFTDDNGKLEK